MVAVTSKGLLRAYGHHSRSANHEREHNGNKREDSFHGISSKNEPVGK
jgi:putative IMPACT (imprinted ancient) family translation regulator